MNILKTGGRSLYVNQFLLAVHRQKLISVAIVKKKITTCLPDDVEHSCSVECVVIFKSNQK